MDILTITTIPSTPHNWVRRNYLVRFHMSPVVPNDVVMEKGERESNSYAEATEILVRKYPNSNSTVFCISPTFASYTRQVEQHIKQETKQKKTRRRHRASCRLMRSLELCTKNSREDKLWNRKIVMIWETTTNPELEN